MSDDPVVDALLEAIYERPGVGMVAVKCLSVTPFLVSIDGAGSVPGVDLLDAFDLGDLGYGLIESGRRPVCLRSSGDSGGGGGSAVRTTSTPVVTSIGAGSYDTVTIPLSKSFRLLALVVNAAARVRLFATAAGAAADIGRSVTVDPPDGRGVILDYVTTHAGTYLLSPLVDGSSMETVPSSSITAVVDNPDVGTASISVSFIYLPTE